MLLQYQTLIARHDAECALSNRFVVSNPASSTIPINPTASQSL